MNEARCLFLLLAFIFKGCFLFKGILFCAYNCLFLSFELKKSKRRGSVPRSGPVFRMERAVPITGQCRRVVLHWTEGTRSEADPSESGCWEMAQKRRSPLLSSPFLFLSFLLLCCLHLSSPLCPSAPAAQKPKPPLLSGDTYVFSGRTDFRPGACTEKGEDWSCKFTRLKPNGVVD